LARKGWGIQVIGLQDCIQSLQKVERAFNDQALKECLLPSAIEVRDRARALAPVGSKSPTRKDGTPRRHLRDAIFAARGKHDEASVIVGVDRLQVPHAHLIEFGHGGPRPAPAHPYLRPAFDAVKNQILERFGEEVWNRIISKLVK
jgi:HK97 gp10 family phage protein